MPGSVLLGIHGGARYRKVEIDRTTATGSGPAVMNTNRLENGDLSPYALMWRDVSGEIACRLTFRIEVAG